MQVAPLDLIRTTVPQFLGQFLHVIRVSCAATPKAESERGRSIARRALLWLPARRIRTRRGPVGTARSRTSDTTMPGRP